MKELVTDSQLTSLRWKELLSRSADSLVTIGVVLFYLLLKIGGEYGFSVTTLLERHN